MHVGRIRQALVAGALGAVILATSVRAEDWPNWRGPNHDGVSAETGLITTWEGKPPVVWEFDVGPAFSAFACVDGRAYTCGTRDKQQVLFCFDGGTGKVLWQKPFAKEFHDTSGGDGTRATPTVDEDRVYIVGACGRLVCFDAKDGAELWSREFAGQPKWGYAGSVLIEGDLAIVPAGGDGGLLALNKQTGGVVWKCSNEPAGYATPYPFTLDGQRYIVGFLAKAIIIADAKTGREVWRMPWETSWDVNAATPIFHNGQLLVSSGYKHGAVLVKLTPSGDSLSGQTTWESKVIQAKFQTPVLYNEYLYTSDDTGQLKCVEFATGQEKWGRRGIAHGTVVLADGHLFVLSESGELLIGRASPEGFTPTTQVQILDGRCWTVPTLYKGRLYARNLEKAVCLKLTH